jgi:GNAT superfamily N-acetyltransferase
MTEGRKTDIPATSEAPISVRNVEGRDVARLETLTAGNLRPELASARAGNCSIGAWRDAAPVGLAVTRQSPENPDHQDLLSLVVVPVVRRRGVGSMLLDRLSAEMRRAGRTGLVARWSERLPLAADFARTLAANGWAEPVRHRLRMTFVCGDRIDRFGTGEKIRRRMERRGITIASFTELGADLDTGILPAIDRDIATGQVPEWARPGLWQTEMDRDLSLLMRSADGRRLGWIVCGHEETVDRWRVLVAWVARDGAGQGAIFGAMADLLRRLEAAHGSAAPLLVQPSASNGARLWPILEGHFRASALWADHVLESRLDLV